MPRSVLFLALSAFVLGIGALILRRPPLLRGMVGETLVSPARPALAVRPGPGFALLTAWRAEEPVPGESLITPARAEQWAALWERPATPDRPAARLAALLCVLEDGYRPEANPDPAARADALRRGRRSDPPGATAVLLLPAAPEAPGLPAVPGGSPEGQASPPVLTQRFVFPDALHRAVLVLEYSEACPARLLPRPQDDPAALSAFEDRAAAAFSLIVSPREPLPRPEAALPYPPPGTDRKAWIARIGRALRYTGK